MYERFTERAREVVIVAEQEAAAYGCRYVGTEHLLVGLLADEASVAAMALDHLNIDLALVQPRVKMISAGTEREENDPPPTLTEGSKKVLELSLRAALNLGHNYIGTEHILLGLTHESKSNNAMDILRDLGVTSKAVKDEVVRMLSGPKAPILTKDTKDSPTYAPKIITDQKAGLPEHPVVRNDVYVAMIGLARKYPDHDPVRIIKAAKTLYDVE